MARKKRRSFTATQKARILRRHHVDKIPVSQICEEEGLQPSVFYYWQKQAFENLEAVLQSRQRPGAKEKALEAKIEKLEARLARKNHVIAVISEEQVALERAHPDPGVCRGAPATYAPVSLNLASWMKSRRRPKNSLSR